MVKIKILTLLTLFLFLTACSQEGGGVIVTQDPQQPDIGSPQSHSGDPGIPDDPLAPDPEDPRPYTFDQFQTLVNNTPDGGTLELEKDAEFFGAVNLTKSLTITSSPSLGRNAVITSYNGNPWILNANNISMNHLTFNLYNNLEFASGSLTGGFPTYSNLALDHLILKLQGRSSVKVTVNGFYMTNSTVLGLSQSRQTDIPLMSIIGNNFFVAANNIIDVTDNYQGGLFLTGNLGGTVTSNVIRVFAEPFYGAISLRQVDGINLSRNILYDRNTTKINALIGNGLTGSVAISFENSNNISDGGSPNAFNATYFNLNNTSTNINLTPGSTKPPFTNADLFNNLDSEDYTPMCLTSNPGLSSQFPNPFISWESYSVTHPNPSGYEDVTLYYSGAIRPACR